MSRMLLGAVAFFLLNDAFPAVWAYFGGPAVTPDRLSALVFALALGGRACTFAARRSVHQRAALEAGRSTVAEQAVLEPSRS